MKLESTSSFKANICLAILKTVKKNGDIGKADTTSNTGHSKTLWIIRRGRMHVTVNTGTKIK